MSKKIIYTLVGLVVILVAASTVYFLFFVPKSNEQSNQVNNVAGNSITKPTVSGNQTVKSNEPITRVAVANNRNDINGPFYHQVYSATSTDGLSWQTDNKMLFDHASVPGAIIMGDGTIFVYFVDGTNTVKGGPAVAKSTDLGKTWTEYATNFENPIRDKNCFADPEAELLDDGIIRLYLVCFPQNMSPNQKVQSEVISALSGDGLNFKIEDGQRTISQTNETLTDADVIKIGDLWKMYISSGPKVVSFTSNDGLSFTREDGYRNSTGAVTGSYLVSDNLARHYYCAQDGIRSATSSGGDWIAETGTRIEKGENKMICDPTVIKLSDGTYKMFYKIQP